jgi:hypothetical protein
VISIEARATGRRAALAPERRIPRPETGAGGEPLTLRELIAAAVRDEVAAYSERRAEASLVRALSDAEIAAGLERGRVSSGGGPRPRQVSADQAVDVALEAFVDGFYLVVIDGRQYERLDEVVLLGDDSRVVFLRLVPLAGG